MPLNREALAMNADAVLHRMESWIGIGRAPTSPSPALANGLLAAATAVALGSLIRVQTGGGEPLMAIFPILMIVCLRSGALAGWVTLTGGVIGAWYVYLGQQFSFNVGTEEARALVTAAIVGTLLIGVCTLLRESHAKLHAAHAASEALAIGLTERTRQLAEINTSLSGALADRARAQQALAMSEAQFRASFEHAAVGKVQSDPRSGRIIRVNKSFATMLGCVPDDLIGRLESEFTIDEDQEGDRNALQALFDGREDAVVREKRYRRRDGQAVWGRLSVTVTRAPETGYPLLVIAVVENIDSQYKAWIALEETKKNLEGLLQERTVTLTQRDRLIREVYHRVRNNMQVVDSLLVIQGNGLSDRNARAALADLRRRVFALGLAHNQLMRSHDYETFGILPLLEELSENLLQSSPLSGVRITVRGEPVKVGLDFAIPISLILTELLASSLKKTFPVDGGTIEVVLELDDDGTAALVFSDNGAVVDEKPAAPDETSRGTIIVETLVRQLRGAMTVRRTYGRNEIRITGPVTQ